MGQTFVQSMSEAGGACDTAGKPFLRQKSQVESHFFAGEKTVTRLGMASAWARATTVSPC